MNRISKALCAIIIMSLSVCSMQAMRLRWPGGAFHGAPRGCVKKMLPRLTQMETERRLAYEQYKQAEQEYRQAEQESRNLLPEYREWQDFKREFAEHDLSDCFWMHDEHDEFGGQLLNNEQRRFLSRWSDNPLQIETKMERLQDLINRLPIEIDSLSREINGLDDAIRRIYTAETRELMRRLIDVV